MKEYTIADFLKENAAKDNVSFHMPGHKGRSSLYEEAGYGELLREAAAWDITEIPGADTLYSPRGALRNVMDNYAELYGARHTELLVNGSSAGIIAAIISSVPVGGKLILGRNSHHSAFSALRLGGINPVYIRPETDPDYNIAAGISPYELEAACNENPDASAVLITSPNYCGMLSDIGVLADVAHDHGMLLIVDQAHGAHLKFFDYYAAKLREDGAYVPHPRHAAESLGADIVVNSTHKTLLSFTGSGILNICSDSVDIASVSEALRMVQTTSPSYLIMQSLDLCAEYLAGDYRKALAETAARTELCKQRLNAMGWRTIGDEKCKITIASAERGISGDSLGDILRKNKIEPEYTDPDLAVLMTTPFNTEEDFTRLEAAMADIRPAEGTDLQFDGIPEAIVRMPIREAAFSLQHEVPVDEAAGRICGMTVTSCQPSVPIAVSGEEITPDIISILKRYGISAISVLR